MSASEGGRREVKRSFLLHPTGRKENFKERAGPTGIQSSLDGRLNRTFDSIDKFETGVAVSAAQQDCCWCNFSSRSHKTHRTTMENNAAMVEETKSTAPLLATTNVTNDAKTPIEADISKKVQQRAKLEAHLNSACGIGKKRRQLLSAFWGTMWMELERIGWLKVGWKILPRRHLNC